MEDKFEERDPEINDHGYRLSEDGLTLLQVTNAALDENGHFTIPEGVTEIENRAFYKCESLTTVHIPKGVTSIGYGAFYGCTSLTTIHIPEGVTFIGNGAFAGCESLTTAHIPGSVTSIGSGAFYGCTSLTTVHIPEGVTYIGDMTFRHCTSLTNVIIKTDNESELNRIKNLLPENLRDKVISRSVYEILRGMVDRFSFEAAGGAHFNKILRSSGLLVTNINQIIASYLPEAVGHILKIIKEAAIPPCLPNAESKITYRELLAQSIGRYFPHHPVDEKESSAQGQPGSTRTPALFTSALFTSVASVAGTQSVAPTRGQRSLEAMDIDVPEISQNNALKNCCIM